MTTPTPTVEHVADDLAGFTTLAMRYSLNWRIQVPMSRRDPDRRLGITYDPSQLAAVLGAIGSYNAFSGRFVYSHLRDIWPEMMWPEVGREGSPALYLTVPHTQSQRSYPHARCEPIDNPARIALANRAAAALVECRADEVTLENRLDTTPLWWHPHRRRWERRWIEPGAGLRSEHVDLADLGPSPSLQLRAWWD